MTDDAENEYEFWDLRRVPIPEHIEQAIITPHDHESMALGGEHGVTPGQPHNRPLWIIWVREKIGRFGPVVSDEYDFPRFDCIADTEESARYHYRMAVSNRTPDQVSVERIPANHRFASSLGNWQMKAHMAIWKVRAERNKREGD